MFTYAHDFTIMMNDWQLDQLQLHDKQNSLVTHVSVECWLYAHRNCRLGRMFSGFRPLSADLLQNFGTVCCHQNKQFWTKTPDLPDQTLQFDFSGWSPSGTFVCFWSEVSSFPRVGRWSRLTSVVLSLPRTGSDEATHSFQEARGCWTDFVLGNVRWLEKSANVSVEHKPVLSNVPVRVFIALCCATKMERSCCLRFLIVFRRGAFCAQRALSFATCLRKNVICWLKPKVAGQDQNWVHLPWLDHKIYAQEDCRNTHWLGKHCVSVHDLGFWVQCLFAISLLKWTLRISDKLEAYSDWYALIPQCLYFVCLNGGSDV